MPIFGSDGALVGLVGEMLGMRIVLKRDGVQAAQHYIPLSWVANVTDRVTLDCPAAQARPPSATAAPDQPKRLRMLGPAMWAAAGVAAVLLAYIGSTLIPRGSAPMVEKPVPPPSLAPSAAASTAASVAAAPTPVATTGPSLANPASIAEFLNSDAPVPQRFSLDGLGFAPGSATLSSDAAKVVDGIAHVMRDRPNTKIKLATLPGGGGVALRRVAAIRDALLAQGVAAYRITTGASRARAGASQAGVEIVVLAK